MKFLPFSLVLFAITMLFTSCVSTSVASLKDPRYRNSSFGRILVIGNYGKIESVQKAELLLVKELQKRGIYAVPNHQLLPPLRTYTIEEKREVYMGEKLDSYIVVSPNGANNATLYVPSYSTTRANVNAYNDQIVGQYTTTSYSGGTRNIVSSIDTQAILYDFQNGNIIWKGQANSQIQYNQYGMSFATLDTVFTSFSSSIVNDLEKNSLLNIPKSEMR